MAQAEAYYAKAHAEFLEMGMESCASQVLLEGLAAYPTSKTLLTLGCPLTKAKNLSRLRILRLARLAMQPRKLLCLLLCPAIFLASSSGQKSTLAGCTLFCWKEVA